MKKYDIEIEEVLRKVINVEAKSVDEAIDKVENDYHNEKIILDYTDLCETNYNNLNSKKLDKSLIIVIHYSSKNQTVQISSDNHKRDKYVCESVRDLKSCFETYVSDYIDDQEIEAKINELEEELER